MSVSQDLGQDLSEAPVDRLPPELLISIFNKLSSAHDMRTVLLVSKKWAVNVVALLWHRPTCNTWPNLEKISGAVLRPDGLFQYRDLIKRLNLSGLNDRVNDGSIKGFEVCKRIERLTLTNCSKLSDMGVSNLLEGNKHLQALDVSDVKSLTDHTLDKVAENCPRLQGLNITGCFKVTDQSLIRISRRCRQIKRLKLNNCVQTTDRAIQSFADNCPSMLEIDLHDCKNITSGSVTSLLSTLRNLRELRLAQCIEVNDSAFLELPPAMMYESLRILDLTACERVGDDAVQKIISAAPRLRNLVLAKCKHITDKSVMAITKLGKNLHYIHLGHCSHVTDTAVIQLVKMCNRIRYIDLACCNRLTDASVRQLATLPKLRRIGLVKCQAITDQSIFALAKAKTAAPGTQPSGTNSLERVHLSYCVNLTLEGIHGLLNACTRLTHLSLTGVQAFLHEDLTAFCREAPPEFTHQQREVFCVFSGEGVNRLRAYLNRERIQYDTEGTMYDDAEEEGDGENAHMTGLMAATAITDEDEEMGEDGEGDEDGTGGGGPD